MTFYSDDFTTDVNLSLDKVAAPLGERLGAAFDNGLREGPLNALLRYREIDQAVNDEYSLMVSKELADEQLKEWGIKNIEIPEEGVTKRYLDIVTAETKKRLAKEQILRSSPSGFGATSATFLATLAGNMSDPANVALMFVPALGQAKAASFLGRTATRFKQGALIGGAQAAAVEPFISYSANALGEDYTLTQSLQNMVFGMLAGGAFVSIGGGIGEGVGRLRGYRAGIRNEIDNLRISNDYVVTHLDNPNAHVNQYHSRFADDMAFDEVVNMLALDLEYKATGRLSGAEQKAIRTEINDLSYQLREDNLNKMFRDLEDDYHTNTVSGRKAKQLARKEVEEIKQDLQDRLTDLEEQLNAHKTANQAINDLNEIRQGRLPNRLRKELEQRKKQIFDSIKDKEIPAQTAIERIDSAHWMVREQALRASISGALEGKVTDIEPFFDLADPLKRQGAMKKLLDDGVKLDDSTMRLIDQADSDFNTTAKTTDYQQAADNLNYHYELAATKADQNNQAAVRSAIDDAMNYANDESISKAARAYALCRIGR